MENTNGHTQHRQKFVVIAHYKSHSREGVVYTVKQNTTTMTLSCDCPGWIYSKNPQFGLPRTCPHVRVRMDLPRKIEDFKQTPLYRDWQKQMYSQAELPA